MKSSKDAVVVKSRISQILQEASEPYFENEQKPLTFLVIGGGPSGVECCASLADYLSNDATLQFGNVARHAQICLIEKRGLLTNFDPYFQKYVVDEFKRRRNISVIISDVSKISDSAVTLKVRLIFFTFYFKLPSNEQRLNNQFNLVYANFWHQEYARLRAQKDSLI